MKEQMSSQDPASQELNLLMPRTWNAPLWKRLAGQLHDRIFREDLPPLQVTSRPVNVGMLVGDILSLPWYRTVFTNVGNVITPETLPPLETETIPADVGELVSDQLSHLWWQSLLRNLADRVAPERLPPLELTSKPAETGPHSGEMQIVRWSSLITLPKVPPVQRPTGLAAPARPPGPRVAPSAQFGVPGAPATLPPAAAAAHVHGRLRDALSRSRVREAVLIAIAIAEATYLVAAALGLI
jgi:hypothetical protein